MPVRRVPGQARYFQSHHQARFAKGDLPDKFLKSVPTGRLGTRLAKVTVENVYTFERPSQRHGAITQGILAFGALGVLQHLTRCGLANVKIGISLKMLTGHFQLRQE
jgi:hypothetical protein